MRANAFLIASIALVSIVGASAENCSVPLEVAVKYIPPMVKPMGSRITPPAYPIEINIDDLNGFTINILRGLWVYPFDDTFSCMRLWLYETNGDAMLAIADPNNRMRIFAAGMSITRDRLMIVGAEHVMSDVGLGVMVPNQVDHAGTMAAIMESVFNAESAVWFFSFIAAIGVIATTAHSANMIGDDPKKPSVFEHNLKRGYPAAFSWVFKAVFGRDVDEPRTIAHSVIYGILIIISLALVGAVAGAMAAMMAGIKVQRGINGVDDLGGQQTVVPNGTIAHEYLSRNLPHIPLYTVDDGVPSSIDDAEEAILNWETTGAKAYVNDITYLHYLVTEDSRFRGFKVVGEPFDRTDLGIAYNRDDDEMQLMLETGMTKLRRDGHTAQWETQLFSGGAIVESENNFESALVFLMWVSIFFLGATIAMRVMIARKRAKELAEASPNSDQTGKSVRDLKAFFGALTNNEEYQKKKLALQEKRKNIKEEAKGDRFVKAHDATHYIMSLVRTTQRQNNTLKSDVADLTEMVKGIQKSLALETGDKDRLESEEAFDEGKKVVHSYSVRVDDPDDLSAHR